MMPQILKREIVYQNPWIQVESKTLSDHDSPYYSVKTFDYVSVLAQTEMNKIILVRQYRAAYEGFTLELPAGLLDVPGESPETTARRELLEETSFLATDVEAMGCLRPDIGRLDNNTHCFWAPSVRFDKTYECLEGDSIEVLQVSLDELRTYLLNDQMLHALDHAAICRAILLGLLKL
jgi:ADP-ribose pyrophosphatase